MKRFTKMIILLALAMLLVGASIASASVELPDSSGTHRAHAQTTSSYDDDDDDDYVVDLENATVPWEVPSLIGGPDESQYQCSDIPEGLEIVPAENGSDRYKFAKIKDFKKNDRQKIVLTDIVSGTAVDQYGGTYTFFYKNKATYRYNGHGVVRVKMKDTFWMKGGDVDYTVKFNWHWMYEAPDGIEVEKIYNGDTLVNLHVSPGPFPTDDGFTESPNIIPGSWKQIKTKGFIFGCDPI